MPKSHKDAIADPYKHTAATNTVHELCTDNCKYYHIHSHVFSVHSALGSSDVHVDAQAYD